MVNLAHILAAAGVLVLPAIALAEPAGPLQLTARTMLVREIVEAGQRRETLGPADRVVPGDTVEIATGFTNTGTAPIEGVTLTSAVPKGLALTDAGGCVPSVDGGTRFDALARLTVTQADGTDRPAVLGDVTTLRCTIAAVPPGGSGQHAYRAIVK